MAKDKFLSAKAQEEGAELDAEHKMYDLDVTAEERGYEVDGPKLAPENELREDPRDSDSPKSIDSDESDSEEDNA